MECPNCGTEMTKTPSWIDDKSEEEKANFSDITGLCCENCGLFIKE